MMQYVRDGGKHFYQFDSMAEMQRYVDTHPQTWKDGDSSRTIGRAPSWDMNVGYDGAVRMARDGWLEGARRAQKALEVFVPRDPAPATRNDFYGHLPHVPRFCAGAPDSMIRYAPDPLSGTGRVVTVYVAISTGAGSDADYMANYGVAIAQYVNQLEQAGKRVELFACKYSSDYPGNEEQGIAWRVKAADQPIDLAVLTFAFHPACFRRIVFAMLERSAVTRKPYGYGIPSELTEKCVINPPVGAYYLNGMKRVNSFAKTVESALEYVSKQIGIAADTERE